jgi:DNA-binding LacI/PurR family transcriptional regulator/DNA-binding transcriptional regulator YhcF (GntR family)
MGTDMKQRAQEPADSRYLYQQIYGELKKEILSGKYRRGDWFPPERVLKDRFGTTHLTVRNALAKLVLEGYIERYSGKGTVVIYAREGASAPRSVLRFPWAHAILENLDGSNAALLETLEAQLRKLPLAVRVSCHHGDVLLEQGLCREAECTGALVILQPARAGEAPVRPEGPPGSTIVIDRIDTGGPGPRVFTDGAEGARRAARRFLDRGYHRVALLSTSAARPGLQPGFLSELAARGLPEDSGIVEVCAPGVEGGAAATRQVWARAPDCGAFFCSSDETAAGVMSELRGAGLEPGRDAAVIGFGNTRLARGLRLSSVDPGADRLAERVVSAALTGMIEGALPDLVFAVAPELILRDT